MGDKNTQSVNSGLSFDKDSSGVFYVTDEFGEFNNLAHKNLKTDEITLITKDIGWDVDGFTISKDGKRAAFKVNENGYSSLYLLNTSSFKYKKISSIPIGLIGGIQFNDKADLLGLSINTYMSPSESYTLELKNNPLRYGELTKWTNSEIGGLDTASFISPKLMSYKSFDGLDIPAFIYAKESKEPLPVCLLYTSPSPRD